MPLGPGKYGARAEQLLREVGGRLVVVITIGHAPNMSAFDVASADPEILLHIPETLRGVAAAIEADLKAGKL